MLHVQNYGGSQVESGCCSIWSVCIIYTAVDIISTDMGQLVGLLEPCFHEWVSYLEFIVRFQHKYGHVRDE